MKQLGGLVSGLAGGALGGLLGVGGGIVMVPLITRLSKLTQHQAHGTSLFAIIFTALAGSVTYYSHGYADFKVALIIAASAIFTASLGALFAHSLSERKLRRAFGLFLMFASLMLLFKGYLPAPIHAMGPLSRYTVFLAIGSFAGFLSGMLGVGGGAVMVPCMVIIGSTTQHMAQGTSLLAMVPIAISGVRTHHKLGNVSMGIAWGLAVGAVVGGYLGAMGAEALPDNHLRILSASLGIWMSTRYLGRQKPCKVLADE